MLLLCKDLYLLIANGRLGKDKGIGALTCKEATVVDYCILSPELFTCIIDFEILPFDPLVSDIHNAMYFEMSCKNSCKLVPVSTDHFQDSNEHVNIITKPKWENDKCQDFNNFLVDADINSLVSKLVSINIDQVHNAVINSIVDECNTIILGAAFNCNLLHEKNMLIQTVNNCNKQKKVNKPWVNKDCSVKRKQYHRCYNWRVRTVESKLNLTRCSKEYKNVLCKQYNLYKKNCVNKLRNLRQNDCKSYWNLLNRTCCS